MLTLQQARKIAEKNIKGMSINADEEALAIIEEETIEMPYAYIFCYASNHLLKTADPEYAIAGNAPLFISKIDGHISTYSTSLSIDKMIDEYEEENNIWALILTDDIYLDIKKLGGMRQTLNLSVNDLTKFKSKNELLLARGCKTRLLDIQRKLLANDIRTEILQQASDEE